MNNIEFKEVLYGAIDNMQRDGQVYDPTYQIFTTVEVAREMIDIILDLCDEAGVELFNAEQDIPAMAEVSRKATNIFLEKGFITEEVHDRAIQNIENTMMQLS